MDRDKYEKGVGKKRKKIIIIKRDKIYWKYLKVNWKKDKKIFKNIFKE